MSNCFSLASAEPFFNLLTASEQEEEGERKKKEENLEIRFNPYWSLCCYCLVKKGTKEKWEAQAKAAYEEARYDMPSLPFVPFFLIIFLFFTLSQELLRVREVPGELETNGGWHHDRTLHQSLRRLFGYLPGQRRKNCYSFSYILPGSAGTLPLQLIFSSWRDVMCVREWEKDKVLSFFKKNFPHSDQLRMSYRCFIFFLYLSLHLDWDNWFVTLARILLFVLS